MCRVICFSVWLVGPWYFRFIKDIFGSIGRYILLIIFLVDLLFMEMFSSLSQPWLIERVNLYLRLDFLIEWKIVGCGELPFVEVIKGQAMPKENIPLFAFRVWQDKIFVLYLFQLLNLRFDDAIGGVWVDWFSVCGWWV